MKIGYARVSTEEQHLDLQLAALKARKCDVVFSDHGISGARFDRPGLEDALARAERGDTFVVWRLDRLGRSLSHLVRVVGDLSKRGVEFESLTENIDTKSPTGMLIFHMIAALAEFERALISERTRAGVAAARSRGKKVGRPPALSEAQREQARNLLEGCNEAVVAQTFNVHLRTLRRHLDRSPSPIATTSGQDDSIVPHDQVGGHQPLEMPIDNDESRDGRPDSPCWHCIQASNVVENGPGSGTGQRARSPGTAGNPKKSTLHHAEPMSRIGPICSVAGVRRCGQPARTVVPAHDPTRDGFVELAGKRGTR